MSANGDEQTVRSGRRSPQPVARDALGLLRHHLNARGFAQIELVTRWAEIAGSGLAEHCFPYRLSAGGASGATLTLVADDRAALELQHQAPKVIDKINAYFGKPTVSKIKVVAGDVRKQVSPPRPKRTPNAQELADLESRLSQIEDAGLRAAFARLGRHALAESRKSAIYRR